MTTRRRSSLETPILWSIALLLVVIIFVVDVFLPLGIAGGVPYIIVILFSWLFHSTRQTIIFAIVCTGAIVLGGLMSVDLKLPYHIVLVNRVIAFISVWITALLVTVANNAQKHRDKLISELDQRVVAGVAELEEQMEELSQTNDLLEQSKSSLVSIMEELKESEERFHLMVQGANVGVWDWIDVGRDEEWWSPKFYELLGYDNEEIIPSLKSFGDHLHPDDQEKTFTLVQKHFSERIPFELEYRLRTKSGEHKWFLGSGQAVWDANGKPIRMVGSISDIHQQKLYELELIHQKDLLSEAQEIAKLGSYEWFPETNKVVWSEQFYKILELDPNQHKDGINNIFDFIHPEDKALVETVTAQAIKEKRAIPVEYRILTTNGSLKYVRGEGTSELDEDGNLARMYGTIQDITERKLAENRLEQFFNSSLEFMCVANFEGYFIELNPRWGETFGYSVEELTERPFIEFVHPDDKEATKAAAAKLMEGKELVSFVNRYVAKDGTYRWLQWSARADLNMSILLATARDITSDKEYQEELKRRKEELEVKNNELEQFAYIASHDLQEPLRTLSSFVTLLAEKYKDQFDENGKKYLNYIDGASSRMRELIRGLLDYSRIGKKTELVEEDINEVISNVIEDLESSIKEKNAKIDIADMPTITCYSMEIRLLFQNLIANAIKFRKEDIDPQIIITAEKNGKYWKFAIQDNGIGMEEKYFDKIFILFQRLSKKHTGTGIGLAHCKKIIDLHKGKIWAESELGKGSTFYFTIPTASGGQSVTI